MEVGRFNSCSNNVKLLLITGGVNTSIPSSYTFSFSNKADDFVAYVPAYVRTERCAELGIDTSEVDGDRVDGASLYQQLFADAAFGDRIIAAPHYTVNGYRYDATGW